MSQDHMVSRDLGLAAGGVREPVTPLSDPSPWFPETDPKRLKVLGKLGEETGELSAAICRCIIQGIDEAEPVTGKLNREWLEDEIADVLANIDVTIRHFGLDWPRMGERRDRKYDYIGRWLRGLTRPAASPAHADLGPGTPPEPSKEQS